MRKWYIDLMYWITIYSQIFLRGRFIHVEIKSTKVSVFMTIFREQPSISPYEHTKSISFRTCVCKVVQQPFIKYLIKKSNSLSICKYAKNGNFCSSYALVDGSLGSRTPC